MPPAAINLDLHVSDVVSLLHAEDLSEVILVGHAYAGMVVTGVAEQAPERLASLVYVNAVAPSDGEAMVDQLEAVRGAEFVARIRGFIAEGAPFMPAPSTAEEIASRWAVTDPADQAFMLPRLSPQPTLTFAQPVRTGNPRAAGLRREFILCSESVSSRSPGVPPPLAGASTISTPAMIPWSPHPRNWPEYCLPSHRLDRSANTVMLSSAWDHRWRDRLFPGPQPGASIESHAV